jgi:hypothetical protein
MANLSELVEKVAEVEGIEVAAVTLIARHVREAGLIAMHGRGLSAAQMTRTDAANLLIAVNATGSAVHAPQAVRAYRRLQAVDFHGAAGPRPPVVVGTLAEAIEQLLAGTARDELPDPFMGQGVAPDFQDAFGQGEVDIALRFAKPMPRATLAMTRVVEPDQTPETKRQWLAVLRPDISLVFESPPSRAPPKHTTPPGDRVEETTIGYRTLRAVGKLIG